MRASEIGLSEVRSLASSVPGLGIILSFIQVEEGLRELEGHWEGFRDSSNHFDFTFDDERDCAVEFGMLLSELYGFTELITE